MWIFFLKKEGIERPLNWKKRGVDINNALKINYGSKQGEVQGNLN